MNERTKEAINILNARYEYGTEHVDAASNYAIITDDVARDHYGIDRPFADTVEFTTAFPPNDAEYSGYTTHWRTGNTAYVSAFLGQEEMEAEIDIDLTDEEIEWIERNSDWTHVRGYWYAMYPGNLSVVATYTMENE